MSDPNTPQNAAPQAAPAAAPAAQAPQAAPAAAPAQAPRRTSTLIHNPDQAEHKVATAKPHALPQSTIEEMAAGKRALERNAPTNEALEAARKKVEAEKKA